ncbi:hypothetical protein BN2497_12599 [Janthinobacterium sp. CG23_2]|nr:hypothetical protein BN2497_12599 [Janthinobacterium sp. CG23_2]CUU32697.1 hypothetical protein BN3177_12599 [Janthinobacterium sp. CG23_2]
MFIWPAAVGPHRLAQLFFKAFSHSVWNNPTILILREK